MGCPRRWATQWWWALQEGEGTKPEPRAADGPGDRTDTYGRDSIVAKIEVDDGRIVRLDHLAQRLGSGVADVIVSELQAPQHRTLDAQRLTERLGAGVTYKVGVQVHRFQRGAPAVHGARERLRAFVLDHIAVQVDRLQPPAKQGGERCV